jgi:predicted nucleic acid-binding Zn finger protein
MERTMVTSRRRTLTSSLGISRVVSARKARNPRHGVVEYGTVRSFTRGDRINHGIVKVGRRYFCSCEDFLNRHITSGTCKHVRAFKAKMRNARRSA